MNEEIANTRDIKTKRDLLLDTLVLKGCKGRGCIKTEFREYRQPPRCQGFLNSASCTSKWYVLPDTDGFLEIIHSVSSRPQLQKGRQQVDCVAVWQWSYDHTPGWGGRKGSRSSRRSRGCSALNREGSLPSACAGGPRGSQRAPMKLGWHWTLTKSPAPCVNTAAAAAAEHILSLPYCSGLASQRHRGWNGSRATPQTLRAHSEGNSEGKRSEGTAVLSDLVLEFKINVSKKKILNSKDSLSLWYLLVPNFWNSPGLGAMLFCARFLLLCIGIKDRGEGSLQSHSTTCLLWIFLPKFSKSRT